MDIVDPIEVKGPKRIGRKANYTLDYYLMVAKQVCEHGMKLREAARVYNMSHGTVHHWKKVYLQGKFPMLKKKNMPPPNTRINQLENRLRALTLEVGQLYLENQMLKKAVTYSQRIINESSSTITSESLARSRRGAK